MVDRQAAREEFELYYSPEEIEDLLDEAALDGKCQAADGCPVDPDGCCPHGKPSILLAFGLV